MFSWFERLATPILGPARARALRQFGQFGVIGVQGLGFDYLIVHNATPWLGFYLASAISFVIVASWNWLLNRIWTFRDTAHSTSRTQLPRFLLANLAGFALNRGTAWTVFATTPFARHYDIIPLLCGTAAGMFVNFYFSRRFVFRDS